MQEDTIAGIATGMGGAIGIIRISGSEAIPIVRKIFRTKSQYQNEDNYSDWEIKSHTVHYGYLVENHQIVDEVMLLFMKGPKSYTREDVVEIDIHGGAFGVQKCLSLILRQGARLAEPGEFTKRAFLNGRIDLSQAEAVMQMIQSQNDFAYQSSIQQLEGSVSSYIDHIRKKILGHLGHIEAALDDPEHLSFSEHYDTFQKETKEEIEELSSLLHRFDDGRMKSEGIYTVIVGKPNAGKSSFMNRMLDQERALVTEIAGTTRDTLEEKVVLGPIVLNLIDTAGIHETEDVVEHLGVNRALQAIEKADLIIYVADSTAPFEEADQKIISKISEKKGIILWNKSDLTQQFSPAEIKKLLPWDFIPFSNETGKGMDELRDYILQKFFQGDISYNNQVYLSNLRQKETVEHAIESLKSVLDAMDQGLTEDFFSIDLMDAYKELGFIHGDTASEDLVEHIFENFCMGK